MSPEWQYSMNTVIGRNSLLVGDSLIPSTEVFFVSPHRDRDFLPQIPPACLRASAVAGWRPMPGRALRSASGKNEESGAADAHQQPQVSTPSNPALCMLCASPHLSVRRRHPPLHSPSASTTSPTRVHHVPQDRADASDGQSSVDIKAMPILHDNLAGYRGLSSTGKRWQCKVDKFDAQTKTYKEVSLCQSLPFDAPRVSSPLSPIQTQSHPYATPPSPRYCYIHNLD